MYLYFNLIYFLKLNKYNYVLIPLHYLNELLMIFINQIHNFKCFFELTP